jgi:molybdopterin converting factor small subunit
LSITILLPSELLEPSGVPAAVQANGKNIGEVFHDLITKYPQLKQWFEFVNDELVVDNDMLMIINGRQAYPLKLGIPLKDGDNITMVLIISGG